MKQFKQLIKELPPKKIVFAYGRFQPPTTGHETLVNAVKKIAENYHADHLVFASNSQDKKDIPLLAERKIYYLKRMFPNTQFSEVQEEKDLLETVSSLSKKYKDITMVVGSDKVSEYKKLLEKHNGSSYTFNSINVVSIGERDPDSDTVGMSSLKMKEAAKTGNFDTFKKGLPHTLTELDGKRLMNEMRQGMGMDILKEQIKFETDDIREQYFAGKIFHVGDIVESEGVIYKIVKRGSNHLLVEDEQGNKMSKWLKDLQISNKEFGIDNIHEKRLDTEKLRADRASGKAEPAKETRFGASVLRMRANLLAQKKNVKEDLDEEESDLLDQDIDTMIEFISEEEYLEVYDDNEFCIVDEETGEHISEFEEEGVLLEVLSRAERIRAKLRFARTEAKRERKIAIALKMRSNTATINKRARKLAVITMKKRLAKKPLDKLSVAEKERLEAMIAKRKKVIDRIAMRLVPKVKKTESDRLTHKNYTK